MQPKENPIASNIKISEGVLETIVKTVISEIPGVARLCSRSSSPVDRLFDPADCAPRCRTGGRRRGGDRRTRDLVSRI